MSEQSKTRPTGNGGSSGLIGTNGMSRNLRAATNGRPKVNGGSSGVVRAEIMPHDPQTAAEGRPKGNGGSPGIAAAYNLVGNDWVRQAAQQPTLIDAAVVIYSRAIENDPYDSGLMLNLGLANLIKGDLQAAKNLFAAVYELSQHQLEALYKLLGLPKFQPESPFYTVENTLRWLLESLAYERPTPAESDLVFSPAEAKEFLYVKHVDTKKE